MTYSKFLTIAATTMVCACVVATDASAQSRGHGGSRGPSRGPSVGHASPRPQSGGPSGPRTGGPAGPRAGSVQTYRGYGRYPPAGYGYRGYAGRSYGYFPRYAPYARYYYPYYPYYPYYRPGFSFGFYAGFGYPYYYGYPYASYGYPYYNSAYPYYGSPYGYSTGAYPYSGTVAARPGVGYGEVRIEDAPKDAEVYADGQLVGHVGDFDGPVRHLPLEAGTHAIEIRIAGMPPLTYDIEVRPGQTISVHANVR